MATISTLTANLELNAAKFRKEMDAAKARVRDLEKGSKRTGRQVRTMGNTFRGASSGVAAIHGPLGGVASRIQAVNSLVSGGTLLWVGLGAAVGSSALIMSKSIKTFSEIESQQLKTQALLQSTGQSAGRTFGQLDEQASEVARATLASTQQIRQAQGIMLTFRTVQEENFDRAISLSQDLAAVLGTQAKDAALQLGKALEEPVIGLTSLRRAGVSFSETEKELIKDLSETGRLAEAQGMILDKLAVQVGGAGSGAAGGISGKVDALSQEWEELMVGLSKSGPGRVAVGTMDALAESVRNLRQAINPTIQDRIKEIDAQSRAVNMQIRARLAAEGETQTVQRLRAELRDLAEMRNEQIKLLVEETEAEDKKQAAASKAAEEARRQQHLDQQARARRDAEQSGSATLKALESQLADGTEKIQQEHQKRLEQIQEMQLAEEEIRRAGFENIEQLRAEFIQRSEQQRDEQLEDIRQKEAEAAQREAERIQKEKERVEKANEDIINLNKERFRRIHEAALEADGQTVQLEQMRHQREQMQLEEDMQRLRERGLATAEIEEEFRQARENSEQVHQQRLLDIEEAARQKRLEGQMELFNMLTNAAIAADERQLAAGIEIAKALFDVKKREKIKEALIAGKVAIQEAWASAPFPANLPAVAITTAETTANVAAIQGVAHGGIDNIPREGTYLLDRGEAVLQPRANEALMDFLDKQSGGQGENAAGGDVNVNFTIVANDTQGFDELLNSRRGQIISIFNDAMNSRGRRGVA